MSSISCCAGLSTIKKHKAADLLSDNEDDVFGFGDADEEAASKLTSALPSTAKNPMKRLANLLCYAIETLRLPSFLLKRNIINLLFLFF